MVKPPLWCESPAGYNNSDWERRLQKIDKYLLNSACSSDYSFLGHKITPTDAGVFTGQEIKTGDAFAVVGGYSIAIRDAKYPDGRDFVIMPNLNPFWGYTSEYLDVVCEGASEQDCDYESVSIGEWSVKKTKTKSKMDTFISQYRCTNPLLA